MKRTVVSMLLLAMACASQQPQPQQVKPVKLGEYNPESGSEPVGVIPTAFIHDGQRNKDVEVSIEYPTRGGSFPVVIFSHGYGSTNHTYEPLISYWTSNGYVCIRPAHADAGALRDLVRDTMRDAYQQRPPESGRNQRRRPPQTQAPAQPAPFRPNPMEAIWEKEREPQWRDRVADVKLVIDSLGDLENRFPELRGKMDHMRVGVGGHSYGAFTAMLIGGVRAGVMDLSDPRVRAILAMSPQGPAANRGLTPDSFSTLRIPAMFMTGTEDRGASEPEDANWRKQAFEFSPAGDKYFVLIPGARHSSFTGTSAAAFDVVERSSSYPSQTPYGQPSTVAPGSATPRYLGDRRIFQTIKVTSLIFWDAYLKNDQKARDLLQPDKIKEATSGVELTKK